jgi:hypothetical protein
MRLVCTAAVRSNVVTRMGFWMTYRRYQPDRRYAIPRGPQAAYHEAGHVVSGVAFGWGVIVVSMLDFQNGYTDFAGDISTRPWWEQACVALAGGVVEAWHVDDSGRFASTAEYERQRALRMVRQGLNAGAPIPRGVAPRIVDCFINALDGWLRAPAVQRAVRSIAEQLHANRSLSGGAVASVLGSSIPPPEVAGCMTS